jgi:hypothetical protein
VGFFEPPSDPPPRPEPRRRPPWVGPPENELGASVPSRFVLARTADLAIGLGDVVAYSTGFAFRLVVALRPGGEPFDPQPLVMQLHGRSGTGKDGFRFGVQFADGRRATTLDLRRPPAEEEPPIRLTMGGSNSSGTGMSLGIWVYPLPPAGPLTIATEWLAQGVELCQHELDAAAIVEAASQSQVLWEDGRPIGGGAPPLPGAGFSSSKTTAAQPDDGSDIP